MKSWKKIIASMVLGAVIAITLNQNAQNYLYGYLYGKVLESYKILDGRQDSSSALDAISSDSIPGFDPEAFQPNSPLYDVSACNHTNEDNVYMALAYYEENISEWMSKGWFVLKKDECQKLMLNLKPPVYAYAESHSGSEVWDGDGRPFSARFCIHEDDKFLIQRSLCSGWEVEAFDWESFEKLDFLPIPSGNKGEFTLDLQ